MRYLHDGQHRIEKDAVQSHSVIVVFSAWMKLEMKEQLQLSCDLSISVDGKVTNVVDQRDGLSRTKLIIILRLCIRTQGRLFEFGMSDLNDI